MSRSNARACQQWNSSERLWVIAHQHIHNCLNLSFAASRLPNSLTHSKAFVYLSEVSASSHPTLIASGTQNTFYYTYDHPHFPLTRFSDGGVRAHHAVHAMLGPRGGGFLFDSNGASCAAHGAHGSNSSWALGTGAHANLLTALSLSLSYRTIHVYLCAPFPADAMGSAPQDRDGGLASAQSSRHGVSSAGRQSTKTECTGQPVSVAASPVREDAAEEHGQGTQVWSTRVSNVPSRGL